MVRLENREHVRVSDQLVYFPPETDEDIEDIKPLLNDLRILKSTLLRKEGYNDIKAFLKNIGVKVLYPKNLISESICPLYRQPDKPSVMKNRRHVRYIFKSWQKFEGSEHSRLEEVIAAESERRRLGESVSEVPILRAYKGTQRKTSDFVVPCNAYLPQAYTRNNDLETYFSVSDSNFWFVDDKYRTKNSDKNSDTESWLQFLKAIGAKDTPRVIRKKISRTSENYQEFDEELKKRDIKSEYSTQWWETNIEDFYLQGLSEVLDNISKNSTMELTRVLWHLLVKMVESLPSDDWQRNRAFQGIYRWFYRTDKQKFFDATFSRQLKSNAWIPGKQGKLHKPSECFAPTAENRKLLGDSVSYLPDSFSTNTTAARWLAGKLGVHLNADADSVLNYLQTMSQKEMSVEDVEPIYKFLDSQDEPLWGFEDEPFIFIPEPEPRWWRIDEVFWENESAVFGDARGYLKAHYSEDLKSFFTTSLEVPERADTLDYVRGIQDITSKAQAENKEIRARVQKLYRCLWRFLQENGDSLQDEEWQEEWEQLREDACWLGRKGDEWEFYLLEELVWNDHKYCAEIVKGKVPFWAFGNDLLEFAKYLGVEGCYQASNIDFDCYSDQGECISESEKVQKLVPYIHDFLNSTPWRGVYSAEETTGILDRLSVRRAQKLEVSYELKGISIPDPNPRQSFLDPTSQGTILWLGLEESEGAYPDLIGDALQDYFDINELREFIKDLLLTKDLETTLLSWKRRGFEPDLCLSPPELDSKEDEKKSPNLGDEELSDETGNGDDSGTNDSENETSTGDEDSKTGDEDNGSTGGESDTPSRRPRPGRAGARWRGGSGGGKPNRSRGTGYGGGGGGEGEKHRSLKEYLAANSSLFGEGLELIDTEYRFGSGDEADILFEDSSGNPITVEVKPPILSGSDQEVWQAVKYKHLAAVAYNLPCEEVRSILVAPEIPDNVKEKCKELGIEPFEVPQE